MRNTRFALVTGVQSCALPFSTRREAVGIEVVEARGDVVLDQVVERAGLDVVATVLLNDAVGRGDRPAVRAVVPPVPPPVEERQFESTVEGSLPPRSSAARKCLVKGKRRAVTVNVGRPR